MKKKEILRKSLDINNRIYKHFLGMSECSQYGLCWICYCKHHGKNGGDNFCKTHLKNWKKFRKNKYK